MNISDTSATISKFRECFSRFGLSKVVVTDNGSQFASEEFSTFLYKNGIQHFLSSPLYHPQTNGIAENAVKTLT